MICPKCKYEWVTRVAKPKACPECGVRFSRLKKKQPISNGFEARDDEPEAIYNNIPDDSDLPRDEDYCQDCGAIGDDCECDNCPDCKNPIPECKCVDDGIELTETGDTRSK